MQWEDGVNGCLLRKACTINLREEGKLLELGDLELIHEKGANRMFDIGLEVLDVVVCEGRFPLAMNSVLASHGRTELLLSDLG